jgi:hypothetical protein
MPTSGYTHCACRDCFDVTISNDMTRPDLCGLCAEAGCEPNNGECQRDDAYGTDDTTAGKDTPTMSTTTAMPSYEQWRLLILLWRHGLFTAPRIASHMLSTSGAGPSDLPELAERGWIAATRDREPINTQHDTQWWTHGLRDVHLRLMSAGLTWLSHNPHTLTMFAVAENHSGWRGVPLTTIATACDTNLHTIAWLADKHLVTVVTAGGVECSPDRLGSGPIRTTDTRRIKLTRRGQSLLDA